MLIMLTEDQRKKMWHMNTVEFYSAEMKKEVMLFEKKKQDEIRNYYVKLI